VVLQQCVGAAKQGTQTLGCGECEKERGRDFGTCSFMDRENESACILSTCLCIWAYIHALYVCIDVDVNIDMD